MATPRLRLGLIGAGGIAREHALGFAAASAKLELVAIAEPNPNAAKAIAEAAGATPRLYDDWRELLEKADLDAVDICLPHDLHEVAAVEAAQRGLHVLIEKPIARNLEEADAIIDAASTAGVKLMVVHDRRFDPPFVRIKELLEEGRIGRPLLYRLDNNQYVTIKHDSWIFSADRLGGGAIMSNLVHQFDLARWFEGDVAQVSCMSLTLPDRLEGEIIGVVSLRFRTGALADCIINWHVAGRKANPGTWYELVWISGETGSIHNLDGVHVMEYAQSDAVFEEVASPGPVGHVNAIAHFADCIRLDQKPLTDGHEGRAALEIAMAAYESERTGTFVDLPLAKDAIGGQSGV